MKKKIIICTALLAIISINFNNLDTKDDIVSEKYFEDLNFALNNDTANIDVVLHLDYDNQNLESYRSLLIDDQSKSYYSSINLDMISQMNLEQQCFTYSEYSPFLFKSYDTYEDYEMDSEFLEELSLNSNIQSLYVSDAVQLEGNNALSTEAITSAGTTYMDIDDIKEMVNISSSNYTGYGVKVGILDAGEIQCYDNFTRSKIHYIYDDSGNYITTDKSEHATVVSSIIGGVNGIAPNADLYLHDVFTSSGYASATAISEGMDYFVSNGVKVINMSAAANQNERYDGLSFYIDWMISTYDLCFVKSTGNNDTSSNYGITGPGLGVNVFTVGAVDITRTVTQYSNYDYNSSMDNYMSKPTVVAPGNVYIPNISDDASDSCCFSGTSLAAPIVTGVLALLAQEFSNLDCNAATFMSAIQNGADYATGQTQLYDSKSGAGIVNYEATRVLVRNSIESTVGTSDSAVYAISQTYEIAVGETIDVFLSRIMHPSDSTYSLIYNNLTGYSNISLTPKTVDCQIKIILVSESGAESVVYVETSNDTTIRTSYSNETSSAITVKINIIYQDGATSPEEYCALTVNKYTS